ncbi:epoxyqueuosine reductase QueH [Photobacterium sp. J15]|uniref:epoxyqueuosine reductase QueH n=1 Tax=Photobacterium sp. J15 TaxID=265901 RepID=UPI0007E310C2|nr:epoxyqueuosine reductase QueH [Photobacterium sp. J15]
MRLPDDFGDSPKKDLTSPSERQHVLMHCCCAPCSSAMIEACLSHGIQPTIFYYNPNIHPEKEYLKRKNEIIRFAEVLGVDFVDMDYDPKTWFREMKGYEHEPERGKRCLHCFQLRMEKTANYAKEQGFTHFTTTLASSRWKDINQIRQAGQTAAWLTGNTAQYWDQDWRKGGLSARKDSLLKQIGFYNQQYCGCAYSLRDSNKWRKEKGRPLISFDDE